MLVSRSWPWKVRAPDLPARARPPIACAKCGACLVVHPNRVRSAKPADNAGVGSGAPSRTNRG